MNLFFRSLLTLFFTATAQADSLMSIYQLAELQDGSYQAVLAKHQANLEKKPQAFSYLLPNISATISKTDGTVTTNDNTSTKLSLSQSLYNKATLHALQQTKYSIASSMQNIKLAKSNLILKVAKAYFNVLLTVDTLQTYQQALSTIDQQLSNIKQRFQVGVVTTVDVTEAQAKKDLSVSKVLLAETKLIIAREKLGEIINRSPGKLQPLPTEIILQNPQAVANWVKIALKNNQTIKIKSLASETARENIELQRAGHYPSLNLTASTSNIDSNNPSVANNTSIGITLLIPLFAGGLVNSKVVAAQHNFIAAKKELNLSQRQTTSRVRELYFTVVANIRQIKATEQLLKSTQAALNAIEIGFDAGTRTITDMLNSRTQMFNVKLDLTKLKHDYLLNFLTLKQVAGILGTKDLLKLDQLLAK